MKSTVATAQGAAPPPDLRLWAQVVDYGSGSRGFRAMRERTSTLCELISPHSADDFHGYTTAWHMGLGVFIEARTTELLYVRTPLHAARSGVDHYQVNLYLSGSQRMEVGSQQTVIRPGDIGILDLGDISRTVVSPSKGARDAHFLSITLPRGVLAPLLAAPDSVCGAVIPGDRPSARLLRHHLLALRREADMLSPAECESVIRATAMLIAGGVGPAPGTEPRIARADAAARRIEIHRYLERHLEGPGPDINSMCRSFGMSRASLFRLFEHDGGLVHYFRRRQLRRAFATLASRAHRHRRVIDIALQYGFGTESSFIRAFRRTFGVTPGQLRAACGSLPARLGGDGPHRGWVLAEDPLSWLLQLEATAPAETRGTPP